jgi:hypothetical protein
MKNFISGWMMEGGNVRRWVFARTGKTVGRTIARRYPLLRLGGGVLK